MGKGIVSPFIEEILNAFGSDRVMYGSDWPVCLLAADYKQQLDILQGYISSLSESEQAKIMGQNAIDFYHLTNNTN